MRTINSLDDIKDIIVKKYPDVFLRRLIFYKSISPLDIIREVNFSLGVNIIATSRYGEDDVNVDIIGHSVGKTTLCRFIRHIFGEPSFSNETSTKLISEKFPQSWLGAEIEIAQQKYAVLRPIGVRYQQTKVANNLSLESLIKEINNSNSKFNVSQDDYLSRLGLEPKYFFENPRCKENTNWLQILSWCSRDQEARYKNIYTWRDPESNSQTPIFSALKEGPLYVIRKVLGLIDEKELFLEKEKTKLEKALEETRNSLKNIEPILKAQVNVIEADIRRILLKLFPNDNYSFQEILNKDGELPISDTIEAYCAEQGILTCKVEEISKNYQKEKYYLTEAFDKLIEKRIALRKEENKLLLKYKDEETQKSVLKNENTDYLKRLEGEKEEKCYFGRCLIKKCYHVNKVLSSISENEDLANLFEKLKPDIEESMSDLSKEIYSLNNQIDRITNDIEKNRAEKERLSQKESELRFNWRQLLERLSFLKECTNKILDPSQNEKFIALQSDIKSIEEDIVKNKEEFHRLLNIHKNNENILTNIFNLVVKKVLHGSNCSGLVSIKDRNISFDIKRTHLLYGQALGVLSVLLSDITALVYSIVNGDSIHPLFLIHDSPKEADLDDKIYESFISFMMELSNFFETPPFQYIITTTTPPPPTIDSKLVLSTNETLLKANIFEGFNASELPFGE